MITNGGPTEPKDQTTGATISRDTLAAQNRAANLFGKVLLIGPRGKPLPLADIWGFERAVNPDKAVGNPAIDSNPVGIIRDGLRFVVADAGGNALDTVDLFGRVRNLAVFPNVLTENPFGGPDIPMQAVPTSIAKGKDGWYYMTQLTGFPFPLGGASIWRVNPRTGEKKVFATGFTNLMDLAVARDGTIYALEIDHDGLLGGSGDGALYAVDRRGDKRQILLPAGFAAGTRGHRARRRRDLRLDQRALPRRRGGAAPARALRDETRAVRRHRGHEAPNRIRPRRPRRHAGRGRLRLR